MDCIVLVKQVPDVSNIPEDAWDREKGTLRRAMLDSILNPLDLHALTFADRLTQGDPASRTVFLTMGPPMAREVLVECLSRVPGEGILLTDGAFAGADTGATAYSLACAIRRIEREIFAGKRDYVIVTGMQSVDGDTAQVPPQIAEELGIDHVAYAKGLETTPELRIRRIASEGIEDVRPVHWPVLITVTACTDPLYRSFARSRQARRVEIREWNAASVAADPKRIGLKGSWTQVYRLFSPSEDRPKTCEYVHDPHELIGRIAARYGQAAPGASTESEVAYDLAGRTPSYHGAFWVFAEREGDGVRSVSLELLGKVRHLADSLGERVAAVLPCADPGDRPAALIAAGADTVYVLQHPLLGTFDPLVHKKAIAALVAEHRPQVMLFGASPLGRELAPRVAYACRSGLTADCTRLEIGDFAKGAVSLVGILKQTRPALGGNVMATIMTKDSETQMATVRPGVFKVPDPDRARTGEVLTIAVELTADDVGLDAVAVESFASKISIRDAEVIVAGGHGFRSRADFETYLQPLAEGLGRLPGSQDQGRRLPDGRRGRLHHPRLPGRPDRPDGPAPAVRRDRDLRGRAAHHGHAGLGDRGRHQQGPQGADLQLRRLRRRRRHRDGRPAADPGDGGTGVSDPIDVLVVGAGPAGLAAAIRLKQELAAVAPDTSVVVIDKAPRPGYHTLSGAAFEPACLDELVPGWRDDRRFMEHVFAVERDEMFFLLGPRAIRIPDPVVPSRMHHRGDVTISLSRLVQLLAARAEKLGVELFHGYSARSLLVEDGRVVGVALGEVGRDKHGDEKPNFRPAEEIRAAVTILADGSRGVISTQFRECFGAGRNPQVYSLGIKAVVQFQGENSFGTGRVVHTLGSPNPASVFGGGFLYSMGAKTVGVGLILGLDWKAGDLTPQREFERFRAHPFIASLLQGSVTIATGAKTIPEGGYHAIGRLAVPGALVVGDGAGFVNMEKIKGIHYAVRSGMAAADTVVEALATGSAGDVSLAGYRTRLETTGRPPGPAPRPQLPAGLPLGHLPRRPAVHDLELPAGPAAHGARLPGRSPRSADEPGRPRRDGRSDVRQPDRLPPPRGRARPHDRPGSGEVHRLRARARVRLHPLLPRPGLPVGRLGDRPERVELPPLHDLRRQVPVRQHPLGAARGRRGPAFQDHVTGDGRPAPRCSVRG